MTYRVLAALPGVLLLLIGAQLAVTPVPALQSLGMPLLDGIGRSTQLGDLTAFFLGGALMCFIGAWQQNRTWLHAAALLVGATAIFRSLATAFHGAEFATQAIVAEVIMTVILLVCARKFPQ